MRPECSLLRTQGRSSAGANTGDCPVTDGGESTEPELRVGILIKPGVSPPPTAPSPHHQKCLDCSGGNHRIGGGMEGGGGGVLPIVL